MQLVKFIKFMQIKMPLMMVELSSVMGNIFDFEFL